MIRNCQGKQDCISLSEKVAEASDRKSYWCWAFKNEQGLSKQRNACIVWSRRGGEGRAFSPSVWRMQVILWGRSRTGRVGVARQTVKAVKGDAYKVGLYPVLQSLVCGPLVQDFLTVIFKMHCSRLTQICTIAVEVQEICISNEFHFCTTAGECLYGW